MENENYQVYMKTSMDNYIGDWVAICEGKIIAHGKDIKKVFEEAKEACPDKRCLITKIPDKEIVFNLI